MKLSLDSKIILDKFKPRPYQLFPFDALENKGYRKIMLIWPRRCLSGESHILLKNGSFKLLKDIEVGNEILSWDGSKFVPDVVKNVWKTEKKNTLIIRSANYLPITTSADHKFASTHQYGKYYKWKKISDTPKSSYLLNCASIGFGTLHNPDLAEFIGYMISDGYVVGNQQPKFTNTNMVILKRVAYLAKKLFGYKAIWRVKGNGFDLGLSNGTNGGGTFKNKIKELFRDEGQDIPKSKQRLLSCVWDLDEESLGRFFAALISADGSIFVSSREFTSPRGRTVPPGNEISIHCGKSYTYGWEIYWLLRKVGIVPQIPINERNTNLKIRVGKGSGVKWLLSNGRIYGKEAAQEEMLAALPDKPFKKKVIDGCLRSKYKTKQGPSEELYDIETEKYHNFVANGYVVHNSGKDLVCWNLLIRQAIKKIGVYFIVFPTYAQGKKVIWNSITNEGIRFLDYIPREIIKSTNSQDMKVTLANGSIIQIIGSDNADSIVGTNPTGVVFSEMALQDDTAYRLIRPILNANGGWQICESTPRGRGSFFYELYQIANNSTDWFCHHLTLNDTQHIALEDIEKDIRQGAMSRELSDQEYYCSFDMGVEGSYYAKYLDKMRLNGQVSEVPWEPGFKVHTAWDLGMRDSTAIIFFQVVGQIVRIIDELEADGKGLEHYAKILDSKPYQYGKHFAPHDIAVRELGTGLSRIEKARQLGINFEIAPNLAIDDGIEAVRSTLPKIWIDEKKCESLLKSLSNYRKEYDSKKKIFKAYPRHDSFSHMADAIRMLAVSLPRTSPSTSAEELERRYQNAMYGVKYGFDEKFR